MVCRPTFIENGFLKKKTKTEAKFGLLSTTKYHWVTHTQTHTSTEMLTDKNGTRHPVRPTLSSTHGSVPAKSLST